MMYAVKIKSFLFSYCMYNSILVFYIIHFSLLSGNSFALVAVS